MLDWRHHRHSVLRLLIPTLLCVLLDNSAAPLLAAVAQPQSCGAKPHSCACTGNGRVCHCDHRRPAGWWGEAQHCKQSAQPFVSAASAVFSAALSFIYNPPPRAIAAAYAQPAHGSAHLTCTFQRGPPLALL